MFQRQPTLHKKNNQNSHRIDTQLHVSSTRRCVCSIGRWDDLTWAREEKKGQMQTEGKKIKKRFAVQTTHRTSYQNDKSQRNKSQLCMQPITNKRILATPLDLCPPHFSVWEKQYTTGRLFASCASWLQGILNEVGRYLFCSDVSLANFCQAEIFLSRCPTLNGHTRFTTSRWHPFEARDLIYDSAG